MSVRSRLGSGTVAAMRSITASPPFMSQVPRPCSRPSASRDGRLSLSGTVSRWPAITTRSARPRSVRATTLLPWRLTVRWSYAESAASTASAISCSCRLTDSMSTSWRVSETASALRSRTVTSLSNQQGQPVERHPGPGLVLLPRDGVGHPVHADLHHGAAARGVGERGRHRDRAPERLVLGDEGHPLDHALARHQLDVAALVGVGRALALAGG